MQLITKGKLNNEALYKTLHTADMKYRKCNHGLLRLRYWIHVLKGPASILDLGCGNGKLCQLLAYWGYDVTGLDITEAHYEREGYDFVKHDITLGRLPFKDDEFDYCLSFDVLEHLPQEWIEEAIWDMFRVSRNVVLGVSCCERGKFIHRTVQPPEWWLEKLNRICPWPGDRSFMVINPKTNDERFIFYTKKKENRNEDFNFNIMRSARQGC